MKAGIAPRPFVTRSTTSSFGGFDSSRFGPTVPLAPADALAMNVAKEAFKQAADPNCFPEQIKTLGLKPWAPKKLYALIADLTGVDTGESGGDD